VSIDKSTIYIKISLAYNQIRKAKKIREYDNI